MGLGYQNVIFIRHRRKELQSFDKTLFLAQIIPFHVYALNNAFVFDQSKRFLTHFPKLPLIFISKH